MVDLIFFYLEEIVELSFWLMDLGGKKLIFKWNVGVFNGCEKYLIDFDLL